MAARGVYPRCCSAPIEPVVSAASPTGSKYVYIGRMSSVVISRKEVRNGSSGRHPKMDARMFGASLADVFRTPTYECRALGSDQRPEFAVTRLRSGPGVMEKAPAYPPDQAVLICVSLAPAAIGQWRALYNGKSVRVTKAVPSGPDCKGEWS
jgi:hypothetical protein